MRKPYHISFGHLALAVERDGQESSRSAAGKPMDGVIATAAICIFSVMDFSKMETVDWIFTVTFAIWFVLTIVRCCIYYRKSR